MLVLALDTSTRYATIALCSATKLYGEYTWYSENNHSVELLVALERLCAESRLQLQQIDAVAVAIGPGSFNGIRVGLATAKTLAFALKRPLVGISTLDIIAVQQQHRAGPICAVLEAGRTELYAGCFVLEEQMSETREIQYRLRQYGEYLVETPQRLITYLTEHEQSWFGQSDGKGSSFFFCGEMSPASRASLQSQFPGRCLFTGEAQAARRGAWLAHLAQQRLQEGQSDDPLQLEALYLRRPSITTSTRKQPLLGEPAQRPSGPHTTEREEGALRH